MADTVSREQRSKNMSSIRGKDTGPEVYIRKLLFARGYRYRKNAKNVFGHPDIYLAKYNAAIFVNGCFWHRHPGCKYAYTPKSRTEYWNAKFEANISRDNLVRGTLKQNHVRQLIIWECTVKKMRKDPLEEAIIMNRIEEFLKSANDLEEL